jgi:sugar (pentulose or hexulose) kinase
MACTVDVPAAMYGAGVARLGDALAILGTTAVVMVVTDTMILEPELVGFNIPVPPTHWARTMATTAGTSNIDWAAAVLGLGGPGSGERLASLAQSAPSGSSGLLFLPFVGPGGERAPFVKPSARAGFVGLDAGTTPDLIARSVIEGVALSLRHCWSFLPPKSGPLVLTGGGARSALWCQLLADMLQTELVRTDVDQPGSRGAAMMAAVGAETFASMLEAIDAWVRPGERFAPGPARAVYDSLFDLYLEAIDAHVRLWDQRATTTWPSTTESP